MPSEYLAFDLETSGVDKANDVPVSFALVHFSTEEGAVPTINHKIVNPGIPIPKGAMAIHGITDERAQAEGIPLQEAVLEVAEALIDASSRGVPVVGYNVAYDLGMIDACLKRIDGRGLQARGWKGPVLDPLVLDRHLVRFRKGSRKLADACTHYGVTNSAAHDAEGDALASLQVFLAMREMFPQLKTCSAEELTVLQREWYKSWALSFNKFLTIKQKPLIADDEARYWPLGSPDVPPDFSEQVVPAPSTEPDQP